MLQNAIVRRQFLEDKISWVRNYCNKTSLYTDMCYKDALFVTIRCVNKTAECISRIGHLSQSNMAASRNADVTKK